MVLQGDVTIENHYISTTRWPMATITDKIVTYLDGLLPIKSHGPFIRWSCKVTWQTKTIISQQWSPNLSDWWLTLKVSYLLSHMDLENAWSHEITRQIKNILSPLPQCLSPPICRVVDYLEMLLVIKSHVSLIT